MLRFSTASILAALGGVLLLSGCKADTRKPVAVPSAAASAQPVAAPSQPNEPLIVCFGDSLTAGYGTDPGQSYPDDLQRLLKTQGYRYRVVNSGMSGNTTKDGLARVARVIAQHPDIVVVEFGGNDGLRGLPVEDTQRNLGDIIQQLQSSGAKVALAGITLPPDYGPDYIAKFDAMYSTLAKKYRVPLLPFLLQNVYGVAGDMQADNIHATAQGNRQVAANIEKFLEPMLRH